jgi:hypothetical protein
MFSIVFLFLKFYYSCIINFTITILLPLFLPSSLFLLLLCYNPLFSLPTTLSAPSHSLPPSSSTLLICPQPVTTLPFPHTHHLLTTYCTNCSHQPPEIPDTSNSTTTTNIYQNTHGGTRLRSPLLSNPLF